jgi:YggT family protein
VGRRERADRAGRSPGAEAARLRSRGRLRRAPTRVAVRGPALAVIDGKETVSAIHAVQTVLYLVVFLFFVALIVRFVFDWIQYFSRDWRPRGPVLVFAEGAYSATDPAVKALRRLLPPLPLGGTRIDLSFMVLFVVTMILMFVLAP